MIYTELTLRAMSLSYNAHHGQVDKGGVPYIFHPIHLAEQMDDEVSCCAALLHDVVEDTDVTMEHLCSQFPREVTDAVALLTHADDADYDEYVRKIKENPVAKRVKLADVAHNSDETRTLGGRISQEKRQALRIKYARALAILNES